MANFFAQPQQAPKLFDPKQARSYAEALRQRSMTPQSDQMVGGQYISGGLADAIRQLGEGYISGQVSRVANESEAKERSELVNALRGTPGQMVAPATPNDDEGYTNPQAQMPGTPGSYNAFLERAMQSSMPEYQQMGMQGIMTNAQAEAERAKKAQQMEIYAKALQGSTPQQAIAMGVPAEMVKQYYESPNYGRVKVDFKDSGGALVPRNEYGDTPKDVANIDKTGNPFSDLVVRGPDGEMTPNTPLVGVKSDIARAGKPQISVDARNFNTQESEQSKAYGKTLGEMRGVITQTGFDANAKMAQLSRMESLLGSLDAGGKAAPLMADVASLAASAGIKLDPNLGAKEAAQALSVEIASNMRQPGTGPMTDKDFDNFLKRVPDLSKTPSGRSQITQTMRAALQRDIEAAKFARDYAEQNGGVIDDKFYDAVGNFYAENPVVKIPMPATNARGQNLPKFDPDKEKRYQEWLKSQGAK